MCLFLKPNGSRPVALQRGEHRPRFDGSRAECHKYEEQLSGSFTPPAVGDSTSVSKLQFSLFAIGGDEIRARTLLSHRRTRLAEGGGALRHWQLISPPFSDRIALDLGLLVVLIWHPADAIAGFAAVSKKTPIRPGDESQTVTLSPAAGTGMNIMFASTVHCLVAERDEALLRVSVFEGKQEVAYESAVVGRLRGGYRVMQMRSSLGTRIELCYLFVRITWADERNQWATTREVRSHEAEGGLLRVAVRVFAAGSCTSPRLPRHFAN